MGKSQEDWVTPPNDPSHHVKYYLQLKTKEDVGVEALMGDYQEKLTKQR